MLPINPADKLNDAPFSDLVELLLKQFKRLLTDRDVPPLSTADLAAIAQAVSAQADLPEKAAKVPSAIVSIVEESLQVLRDRFDFDFPQALATSMDTIGNWETTAEFLEVANDKSNAELRISAGSTLLVMMGNKDYIPYLLDIIEADEGFYDVDAALARRALLHTTKIDVRKSGGTASVRRWLQNEQP